MKTILLAPTPPPAGGIAAWTVRMMQANLKNGWQISVVDEKVIGNRQVFGEASKRNIIEEINRCLRIWRGLRKELKNPETRIVHSCIPSVTLAMIREYICAIITKSHGKKFIIHFRCTVPNTTKGIVGRFVLKRLCNISDLIILLNQQSADFVKSITDVPIEVIPNFISSNELVQSHYIKESITRVLYVGGIIEDKGISDCLEVAKLFPKITFRFVGDGEERFKKRAEMEGLNNVVFTGEKDRKGVKEEYEEADVFLFLTHFRGEGFSNALCEAMANGLPCIVTDWAANKDMVHDAGGIVVDINDIKSVADAVEVLNSKEVRKKMSQANISKVRAEYTDSVVIDRYISAYERIL